MISYKHKTSAEKLKAFFLFSILPKLREAQNRPRRAPTWHMSRSHSSETQCTFRDGSEEPGSTFSPSEPKLPYEHVNENEEDDTNINALHSSILCNQSSYDDLSGRQSNCEESHADPVNSFMSQIFDQNSENENIFSI